MSTTDRVAILLRQLKNSPELQDAVSNTAKLTTREVLVEPLFAGIDHGVPVPLLSADPVLTFEPLLTGLEFDDRIFYKFNEFISSNDSFLSLSHLLGKRDILDINTRRLQRFVAKESLREFLKVIDVPSLLQNLAKEDEINISDFETIIESKKFEETTKATDFIERLLLDLNKKEILKVLSNINEKLVKTSETEKLNVVDRVLAPKGRIAADRIGIIVSQPGFRKIPKFNNKISVENFLEELFPTKSELSTVRARNLSIQAKARVVIEKLSAKSKTQLKVNKDFEASIDTKSKVANKKVTTKKTSLVASRSEEIIAKARLFVENVKTLSKLRLKTNKLAEEVVKTKIRTSFFVNNALLERFDIRDSVIKPAKAKYATERIETVSSQLKEVVKTENQLLEALIKVSLQPNVENIDTIKVLNSVLTPKARLEVEKLILSEIVRVNMPLRQFTVIELFDKFLGKFLNKQIILPEKVHSSQNVIRNRAEVITEKTGVVSKDRDASGIGDVVFLFGRRLLEFINLAIEVKKEVKKPLKNKLNVRESVFNPRFRITNSRASILDKRDLVFNKVPTDFVNSEIFVKKTAEKPKLDELKVQNFILTPALAEFITEKFLIDDDFSPYLFNKIKESEVDIEDSLKRVQEKKGIKDTLSSSQKGYAWMRDEEYTQGAYFLQPYVAAIPPGRSRQF